MRTVFLAVPRDALAQLAPFLCGLHTHAENLDLLGNVSFRFINEGRHLGPAPGSPPAAVEKHDGRRSSGKCRRKFHRGAIDVEQLCFGKCVSDFELWHEMKEMIPLSQSTIVKSRSCITSRRAA